MGGQRLRMAVYSEVGHPGSRLVSGVTNLVDRLLHYGRATGLDIDLFTYGERDEIRADDGQRIVSIRPRLPLEVYKDLALDAVPLAPRWQRLGLDYRPDVVVVMAPGPIGRLGLRVAEAAGVPAVAFYTTDFPRYVGARCARAGLPTNVCSAAEQAIWSIQRHFYDGIPDLVLAPSRATATELRQQLRAPVDVLGRGVDTERFHPATHRADGTPRLLYVGRVHFEEKNLELLGKVAARAPDARLTVVGDGPHMDRLVDMLGQRVDCRGKLGGEALAAAYREHDLFVFPSKYDTLGQVVLEAMASGLPVVATNHGGPRELIINGQTGYAVAPDAVPEAVAYLAANRPALQRMGVAARRFAETRTWERIFDQLLALCRELCERDRSRAA